MYIKSIHRLCHPSLSYNSARDDRTIGNLVCTLMFFFNTANTNTQYLCMAGAGSTLAVRYCMFLAVYINVWARLLWKETSGWCDVAILNSHSLVHGASYVSLYVLIYIWYMLWPSSRLTGTGNNQSLERDLKFYKFYGVMVYYMSQQSMNYISLKKGRRRYCTRWPIVPYVFQPIPGLISCNEVIMKSGTACIKTRYSNY